MILNLKILNNNKLVIGDWTRYCFSLLEKMFIRLVKIFTVIFNIKIMSRQKRR